MFSARSLVAAVTLALCFVSLAAAHRIEVEPGAKECFHGHQMTVTYEVGGSSGGGQLDIDFYVR